MTFIAHIEKLQIKCTKLLNRVRCVPGTIFGADFTNALSGGSRNFEKRGGGGAQKTNKQTNKNNKKPGGTPEITEKMRYS
jgi:transcriptional regulator CtsR